MTEVEVSLARRIRELAAARPDEAIYRHIGLDGSAPTYTWGWLDRRSSQLAGALAVRGLARGDFLGLGLRNSPQLVLSVFAAWKLGAVPVPVRWDLPDWELGRIREVIQPRVYLGADDVGWVDTTASLGIPDLADTVSPHRHGICSSGSTGTPKVILAGTASTYNPHYGSPLMENWRPVPRPQHIMVPAPMYHVTAFSMLYVMIAGDRLTVLEKFDAARAVDVIERYRVSHFIATPTMLQRMADLSGIESRDLSSLDWINQGAAPMPPSLVHRWAKLIGAERILMSYGMSEGLGLTALTGDEWMAHQGSVGRPLRGTQVRVLDAAGEDLSPGEIGEIYLRSGALPSSGARYLGAVPPPRATADGFKTVGDLGYLDEDGYLHLVDRRVDMIISGGANVFPAEVESALIDHPKVADVVVIGLRDPEWGRRVHALIEPVDQADPPTLTDIRAFAKHRLAAYKVPKSVEIVDAIPRSEATKVNRGRLVEARGG
ncbi:AMP-binding protein [Frankia sp. CNm7]|uniref:AMP-binding protein n=1 Tax=Frankia nepalensis TaxID=1836974 RepID=A0A937RHN5_9ACTN|nr:AMP-binding protein [Frankia nepalensis]MBL7502682.1 AMP-binding protein [Frankia nepalensis]MBL7515035.1 AMP-binding protein [Frankia nepalensis]MBL7518716.1 AMP-binding protein [Frankia nepalensis]MBL7629155.1 AMP-binding protein [Frankia nepalensis]